MPQNEKQTTSLFPNLDVLPMHRRLVTEPFLSENGFFHQRALQRQQRLYAQQAAMTQQNGRKTEQSKATPKQPDQPQQGAQVDPMGALPKIPAALKPPKLPGQGPIPQASMGLLPKTAEWWKSIPGAQFLDASSGGFNNRRSSLSNAWDTFAQPFESAYDYTRMLADLHPVTSVGGVTSDMVRDMASNENANQTWVDYGVNAHNKAMKGLIAPEWLSSVIGEDRYKRYTDAIDRPYEHIRMTQNKAFGFANRSPKSNIETSAPAGPGTGVPSSPKPQVPSFQTPRSPSLRAATSVVGPTDNWSDIQSSSMLEPYTRNDKMKSNVPPLPKTSQLGKEANWGRFIGGLAQKGKGLWDDAVRWGSGTASGSMKAAPKPAVPSAAQQQMANAWNNAGRVAGRAPVPPPSAAQQQMANAWNNAGRLSGKSAVPPPSTTQQMANAWNNAGRAAGQSARQTAGQAAGQAARSAVPPAAANAAGGSWMRTLGTGALGAAGWMGGEAALGGLAGLLTGGGPEAQYAEDSMIMLPNGQSVPRSYLRQPDGSWYNPWSWNQLSPFEEDLNARMRAESPALAAILGNLEGGGGGGGSRMPSGLYSTSAWPNWEYYADQVDNRQGQ